jgi:maleylacetate reductase
VKPFVHDMPSPRVVFAAGALDRVPEEVVRLGATRVVLIADPSAADHADAVAAGLSDRVAARLDEVVMHVPVDVATRAVKAATRADADLLLTIGGGSATGLGKAVAKETGIPILAVPTTYAGSELTPIWGLTEGDRKTTGRDPRVRPAVVVYDPRLLRTLPPGLTAASAMNALAHCVEALYAPDGTPVVSVLAEEAVRVLADRLPAAVARPGDDEARGDALYGAWLGGLVLGVTTMGVHHKLAHVLGGFGLPHAETHASLLPYVVAANAAYAPEAMARASRALGGEPAGALWDLARRVGAPTSLAEAGFRADEVDRAVGIVLEAPPRNPRPVEAGWLRHLLLAGLAGERPSPQREERPI